MNRYIVSFILTSIFFISIFILIIEFNKNIVKISKTKTNIIKLNMITKHIVKNKKEIIKKSINTNKQIKKDIQKKITPKRKRKVIKKTKKIKEKKTKSQSKILRKIISQINTTKHKNIKKRIIKNNNIQSYNEDLELKEKLELKLKEQNYIYELIQNKINSNKKYPKKAIRRNIQGNIDVEFIVSKNGFIKSIKILKGKKIFYSSVKKAINNSFPIILKDNLFNKDLIFKITLVYKLY